MKFSVSINGAAAPALHLNFCALLMGANGSNQIIAMNLMLGATGASLPNGGT
ncbi:hypothetical protein ACS0X5_10865 [Burkholderia gladioli]|uniref:hypothetical protein n=1 Tax=Burkholderia gladioli TaxID=28095 RepID=UPI003F7A40DC